MYFQQLQIGSQAKYRYLVTAPSRATSHTPSPPRSAPAAPCNGTCPTRASPMHPSTSCRFAYSQSTSPFLSTLTPHTDTQSLVLNTTSLFLSLQRPHGWGEVMRGDQEAPREQQKTGDTELQACFRHIIDRLSSQASVTPLSGTLVHMTIANSMSLSGLWSPIRR